MPSDVPVNPGTETGAIYPSGRDQYRDSPRAVPNRTQLTTTQNLTNSKFRWLPTPATKFFLSRYTDLTTNSSRVIVATARDQEDLFRRVPRAHGPPGTRNRSTPSRAMACKGMRLRIR
jgi:hypothetical protein